MNRFARLVKGALLLAGAGLSGATMAQEVSYNIGFASEYYYRGLLQKESSGSAGIDFTSGGFYAGGWTADVGDGLEVDGYFGYGIETDEGFSASIGFTGYYYTGEFDDTYEEINLNFGYGMLGIEYSFGTYGNFEGPEQDYNFLAATVSGDNGLYGTLGTFGGDFEGNYIEVGYGLTISEIDFGVAAIFSSDEFGEGNGQLDAAGNPEESQALVFTIGKTF
ncbi:MAG: TorF family putative porin [Gammaproteobacteria bacterium]|nr:TorF family putative porin [Gammaproteobacteria bacterium]